MEKDTNEESNSDNLRYSLRTFDSENKCEGGQTNVEYISLNTEKESKPKPCYREKVKPISVRRNCPPKLPMKPMFAQK